MADIYSTGKQSVDSIAGGLRFEQDNDRIIGRDQNNIPRMLILASGDDFSMKLSKPNIDVLNAINSNLIFNSNQNIFKIVSSGNSTTNSYTVSGGSAGVWTNYLGSPLTINHGLGYIPSVIAYINYSNQYVLLPTTFQSIVGNSGTGAQFNRISVNVDSNNLYILDTTLVNGVITTPYTAGGLSIKYYLLQESAN